MYKPILFLWISW